MYTVEDLCGMCIIIYTTNRKKITVKNIGEIEFKKTNDYKNLQNVMQEKNSVFNAYKDHFHKAIDNVGDIKGSYSFFVDYKEEKDIDDLIKKFCDINELEFVIALVTGSRYLGNDKYKSIAYTIFFE
jgi:hypothetical protein